MALNTNAQIHKKKYTKLGIYYLLSSDFFDILAPLALISEINNQSVRFFITCLFCHRKRICSFITKDAHENKISIHWKLRKNRIIASVHYSLHTKGCNKGYKISDSERRSKKIACRPPYIIYIPAK